MTISETQSQRTETQAQRQTGRSIMAVIVGIVAGVLPTLITDAALHATHVFPPLGQSMSDRLFVLATAYRIVFSTFGSYVIARLAPNRPMRHALIGGIIGVIFSAIGAALTWEPRSLFGTPLVSDRPNRDCAAVRVAWREGPPHATGPASRHVSVCGRGLVMTAL